MQRSVCEATGQNTWILILQMTSRAAWVRSLNVPNAVSLTKKLKKLSMTFISNEVYWRINKITYAEAPSIGGILLVFGFPNDFYDFFLFNSI